MEPRAGDLRVPLAQLTQNFAIPVEAIDLPPCKAGIVITVAGPTTRMPVFLREGGQANQRRIVLSKSENVLPSA